MTGNVRDNCYPHIRLLPIAMQDQKITSFWSTFLSFFGFIDFFEDFSVPSSRYRNFKINEEHFIHRYACHIVFFVE